MRVVLIGLPNAGKSSLFNALAGAEAIVSDQPGTTRDYLTARVDFGGVGCELVDTPGMESGGDARWPPQAQRQSRDQAERGRRSPSWCIDGSDPSVSSLLPVTANVRAPQIVVLTKHDLKMVPGTRFRGRSRSSVRSGSWAWTRLAFGSAELGAAVAGGDRGSSVVNGRPSGSQRPQCGRRRPQRAERLFEREEQAGEELVAAELHVVLDELGKVSGAVTTDDVLDRIFSRFCIGK